ncbi:MAG: amidophosphoribosyltransferase [Candidatus Riflebacteria bacterium RBG_13_59_9]|nr:MAG: amidophosphoribosyltransferase [Candidatus Riflebacteria bacterium RBG_13_59_9]
MGSGAREKCAVFGVFAPYRDVSRIAYYSLFALQHRGQESTGMAVATDRHLVLYKDMGLVQQVFNEEILMMLRGDSAIGHNRYSTTGGSTRANAQPFIFEDSANSSRTFAISHNGNLVNTWELAGELRRLGEAPSSTCDTEMFGLLVKYYCREMSFDDALLKALAHIRGAYSFVILTTEALYALRDPDGVRPLCLGSVDSGYVVASESAAFPIVGAQYLRDIAPGEMLRIDKEGLHSRQFAESRIHMCMFEFFYFSRPDSLLRGKETYTMRIAMGRQLARESAVEADIVVSVPDSGVSAAIGYAAESGIPYEEALVKNRYVGRTFIEPLQTQRELGVRMKLNPLKEIITGKRIILVDDSVVRGNTSRQMVKMLRAVGAREVHMRLSSPPIKFPCFYGIDFGTHEELIAAGRSLEEIRATLGCDTLHYLSLEGVVKATGLPFEEFCLACFNNERPIPISEQMKIGKFILEEEEHK